MCAFAASAATHYVDLNSPSPTSPYINWPTAATNIQDAIDAAGPGDQILVTNGIYKFGGRLVSGNTYTNRVAVTKSLTVQSVNGPAFTSIQGYKPLFVDNSLVRCVYLTNGAFLSGFTLTAGSADVGGGLWCASTDAVISNCVISGNYASSEGGGVVGGTLNGCTLSKNEAESALGGGAYSSTLNNCTLSTNVAGSGGGAYASTLITCALNGNVALTSEGGGAWGCVLNNCLLSGNGAQYGGGASVSRLNNCTLRGNSATNYGGGAYGGALTNCVLVNNEAWHGGGAFSSSLFSCTVVGNSATKGGGESSGFPINSVLYYNTASSDANYSTEYNFTGFTNCCTAPQPFGSDNFTNAPLFVDLAGGNLRLQSNSPCINSGNNAYVTSSSDLDGNPRIMGGTVDIGAYEYQSPTSLISYHWLQQYGLPPDGSADFADSDGDGMNNWQEWRAGTNPTNALSVLQMLAPSNTASGITVQWQSVSGIVYYLQRSTNLTAQPTFLSVQSNLVGQAGTTIYTDTNSIGISPAFYRVGVQ